MGTPSHIDWADGYRLAKQIGYSFPKFKNVPLSTLIPNANKSGIDLMLKMLCWDPYKRLNCEQCLQHHYFAADLPVSRGLDPMLQLHENNIENDKNCDYNINNNINEIDNNNITKNNI